MPVYLLNEQLIFPPVHKSEENGLLAVGGDLSVERLIHAYTCGIFPWYSEGDPILWWSPNPRFVLFPQNLHISRSLRKLLSKNPFKLTLDTAFKNVITACAKVNRKSIGEEEGTWILDEMVIAYCQLHEMGYAHSVEVWEKDKLVGGLYGVSLGGSFFGESMFSIRSNASKIALVFLVEYLKSLNFDLIDCQIVSDHLKRLGAIEVHRRDFLSILKRSLKRRTLNYNWCCF